MFRRLAPVTNDHDAQRCKRSNINQFGEDQLMRFHGLELNLLVALDALLTHQNVTRAAEQLNLSQSALSGSLARLRETRGANNGACPARGAICAHVADPDISSAGSFPVAYGSSGVALSRGNDSAWHG
jgi:hypothetical protein